MNVPKNLRYANTHEWVRIEGAVAVVGVTDHAQHELTDIVYVEPPAVGTRIEAGSQCAVVESVKAASDIYAPVSGDVIAANEELSSARVDQRRSLRQGMVVQSEDERSQRTERSAQSR